MAVGQFVELEEGNAIAPQLHESLRSRTARAAPRSGKIISEAEVALAYQERTKSGPVQIRSLRRTIPANSAMRS